LTENIGGQTNRLVCLYFEDGAWRRQKNNINTTVGNVFRTKDRRWKKLKMPRCTRP